MLQCPTPYYIRNPFKGSGCDELETIPVGCGKCLACLSRRRNDWAIRCIDERNESHAAYFVTLTYNDENLPHSETGVPSIRFTDIQLFFKRLRKSISRFDTDDYKNRVRYFGCGEYGPKTHRPHYHIIFFVKNDAAAYFMNEEDLMSHWNKGNVRIRRITGDTNREIQYCAKYAVDLYFKFDDSVEPFRNFMSRMPGIGSGWLDENREAYHNTNCHHRKLNNYTVSLPRFYNERIFSKEERTKNAIEYFNSKNFTDQLYGCHMTTLIQRYFKYRDYILDKHNSEQYEL